jgi:hypothetical protein
MKVGCVTFTWVRLSLEARAGGRRCAVHLRGAVDDQKRHHREHRRGGVELYATKVFTAARRTPVWYGSAWRSDAGHRKPEGQKTTVHRFLLAVFGIGNPIDLQSLVIEQCDQSALCCLVAR